MPLSKIVSGLLCYKKRGAAVFFRSIKCRLFYRLGILQLERIFISPSYKCNAHCPHCYEKFPRMDLADSLTTAQVKAVIDQFCRLGGCMVYFCSGEFLLRPDALELIKYARASKLAVSVTSNGLLLNEDSIEELKLAGLTDLIVSLDSADAFRHDKLRGVKGCFEKAVSALRTARGKGINTHIWTYVSRSNFGELEGIEKLGVMLGVSEVFVFFTLLSGNFFAQEQENLSYEERETVRKKSGRRPRTRLEFSSENDYCTGGGFRHICVNPSGEMTFCPPVPYTYGNIKKEMIKDCLKAIRKDYQRFSRCRGQCIVNFPEYRKSCNAKFLYE